MKKEEIRLSTCSTQHPSESKQKDSNRIAKEKEDESVNQKSSVSTNTTTLKINK